MNKVAVRMMNYFFHKKYKYNKIFVFLYLCILASSLSSQTKQIYKPDLGNECGISNMQIDGLNGDCNLNTQCDLPATRDLYLWDPANEVKIIKTKVRVVRENDGTNPAASEREVSMQMHYLNKDYTPYGIQFTYELDYIDDSAFRTSNSINQLVQKMTQYTSDPNNFCNIFVATGPASFGFYPWLSVGHIGLFMNSGVQYYPGNNRSSLTHEMGHELGLPHTFAGYTEVPNCNDDCAENTTTMNNDLRGDWCSDTPPQDASFEYGFVSTMDSCNLPNYFPEIPHINFQSYADSKLEFTPQQAARMHCLLETHAKRINWLDHSNPPIPYVYEDNFENSFIEEYGVDDLNWIDIISTGQEITGFGDDNFLGPFTLNSPINFYGQSFDKIYIGSNGYISFSPFLISTLSGSFPSIPTSDGTNGFIAPFLADLNFTGMGNQGKVYLKSDENGFVVTFNNVPFYQPGTGYQGDNTFQFIYSKNDDLITFQFLDMDDYYPPIYQKAAKPSIIGIESPDGLDGLEVNNYQIPKDSSRITIELNTKIVAVEELQVLSPVTVRAYPNPASGIVNFSWDKTEDLYISIYNILGERIQQVQKINSTSHVWNFRSAQLPTGIYFYSVIGKNINQTGKLMIVR